MTEKKFKNKYRLPNGQWIYHLNSYETDFVFHEIFIEKIYCQHNIKIDNNAIIFDVGANIGLFTLYVKNDYPTCKVYAFEPSPEVYHILRLNTDPFRDSIKTYNCALSNKEHKDTLFYYPQFSVLSGLKTNSERNLEIVMSGIQTDNQDQSRAMKSLMANRLASVTQIECAVTTLSKIIDEEQILRIDLLKVDAEGSELAIIQGIEKHHWHKIGQIVMEIHNKQDLPIIMELLQANYAQVILEQDKQLGNANIYNVFASGNKE